eukprot:728958-Pelagomonas_calceolata.AAC.1
MRLWSSTQYCASPEDLEIEGRTRQWSARTGALRLAKNVAGNAADVGCGTCACSGLFMLKSERQDVRRRVLTRTELAFSLADRCPGSFVGLRVAELSRLSRCSFALTSLGMGRFLATPDAGSSYRRSAQTTFLSSPEIKCCLYERLLHQLILTAYMKGCTTIGEHTYKKRSVCIHSMLASQARA